MADIASPRTPSPERNPQRSNTVARDAADPAKAITPPPSGHISRSMARYTQSRMNVGRENSLASPPATLKSGPPITSVGLYGEVPTLESVQTMDEEQLRRLVGELIPALGEARVSAAHSKLQHSMLTIENEEATMRAEVEHEATRREVQVLQEGTPNVHGFSPKSPQAAVQRNLHLALSHCREVQNENAILDKRLRSSKRMITRLNGENADLKEKVRILRQRIKANRDHFNELQQSGAISLNGTPITEFGTPLPKGTPRTPATERQIREHGSEAMGSQTPFDTLLFAGQLLNGEATSVPGTPSPTKPRKAHPQHTRGAHSLPSLPSTPNQAVPIARSGVPSVERLAGGGRVSFSAPSTQLVQDEDMPDRNDRDSTISVSENENEAYNGEDIPGSQASQQATVMLRRSLGSQNPGPAPNSGKLLQGKIVGQVKKPAMTREESGLKRGADNMMRDEAMSSSSSKKARITDPGSERRQSVGLGIKDWPTPGHRE